MKLVIDLTSEYKKTLDIVLLDARCIPVISRARSSIGI